VRLIEQVARPLMSLFDQLHIPYEAEQDPQEIGPDFIILNVQGKDAADFERMVNAMQAMEMRQR
jgi:hypothetical protein